MSFNVGDTLKLDIKQVVDPNTPDWFGDWFIDLAQETLAKGESTLDVRLLGQRPDINPASAYNSLNCLIRVGEDIQYVPSGFLSKDDSEALNNEAFKEGDIVNLDLKQVYKVQKYHDYFNADFMEKVDDYIVLGQDFVQVLIFANDPWSPEDELPIEISLQGLDGTKVSQWVPTIVLSLIDS